MGVCRRSISSTSNQVSNFMEVPWFMEGQMSQHSRNIFALGSFSMPSYFCMPSFRHQSGQLSHVLYGQVITPSYLGNFSSGIPQSSHFPHVDPFFQRQPQGAEASNPPRIFPSSSVSLQRHRFTEYNGERRFHSRNLEPRSVQTSLARATRKKKDISGTKYNDCYASPSTMLRFENTCNLDTRHDAPPIFHIPLKPETSKDKQQSLMHQDFPPPPTIKYKLTPPSSLTDPEEDPLGNLFKLLQADLAPKRRRCFLEEIDSSNSPEHHPEEHSKPIFLGRLHHITLQERMKTDSYQTLESDFSSSSSFSSSVESNRSTEENSDCVIIDVET